MDELVTARTVERMGSIFLSGTQEEDRQQKEKKKLTLPFNSNVVANVFYIG